MIRRSCVRIRSLVVLTCAVFLAVPARATLTGVITVRGNLASADGVPENGNVKVTMRLYRNATGGRAVLTEEHSIITIRQGLFEAALGVPPAESDLSWLSFQIGADPEMTPRIRIPRIAGEPRTSDPTALRGRNRTLSVSIAVVAPRSALEAIDLARGFLTRRGEEDWYRIPAAGRGRYLVRIDYLRGEKMAGDFYVDVYCGTEAAVGTERRGGGAYEMMLNPVADECAWYWLRLRSTVDRRIEYALRVQYMELGPDGNWGVTANPTIERRASFQSRWLSQYEEMAAIVNAARAQAGQPALELDHRLSAAAERHSNDMARAGRILEDIGTDRSTTRDRARDAGYPFSIRAQPTMSARGMGGREAAEALMEGAVFVFTHGELDRIGIGIAEAPDGMRYYTVILGARTESLLDWNYR